QYYVHPNNQSFKGTTTLCQPIGEALILFSLFCASIQNGSEKKIGDYYADDDSDQVFLQLNVPKDWREHGVIEPAIYRYEALVKENEITIAAYDNMGRWIDGDMGHLQPLYKLLPCFLVLLARECRRNSDYFNTLMDFVENPAADTFVNLHEDFYQAHKFDEYEVSYANLSGFDHGGLISYSESFQVIAENKRAIHKDGSTEKEIRKFDEEEFLAEYRALIPHLPEELVIPNAVRGICPAVMAGDIRAVLFHGPSGTGKTISCKLVCQEIGMPIMDVINCTENLDEFVLGKFMPEDDKIVFKESLVTKAIRYGGAVVFEEINFAKPQYLAFLNSLLDDNGFVRLDNGEVVRRHPNFRFFATMNLGYFGTKELNQALYNRFNVILELAALSDEAIARMLTVRIPECANKVDKLLGVYHKLKKKIDSEELDVVISPRNLENWARLAKYEGYMAAAEKTIIPLPKCDRAMEEMIRGILVLYKWT
ncbi:MAG: AAA family ATPase, partial [Clostridiales bacterium]|nr:AAA family ATPase [Clostridiales bacterium]